jgi:electron transfer flavoprotein beta subunit
MRGIMSAKTKPLKVVEPVAVEDMLNVYDYELPAKRSSCKMIDKDNVQELVKLLREEAKVL